MRVVRSYNASVLVRWGGGLGGCLACAATRPGCGLCGHAVLAFCNLATAVVVSALAAALFVCSYVGTWPALHQVKGQVGWELATGSALAHVCIQPCAIWCPTRLKGVGHHAVAVLGTRVQL